MNEEQYQLDVTRMVLHLLLEFKPKSFLEDANTFYNRLHHEYCLPHGLEGSSWGSAQTQWLKIMPARAFLLTEVDRQDLIQWLGKQSEPVSFQCQLAHLHAEPFLDPAIFNVPVPRKANY